MCVSWSCAGGILTAVGGELVVGEVGYWEENCRPALEAALTLHPLTLPDTNTSTNTNTNKKTNTNTLPPEPLKKELSTPLHHLPHQIQIQIQVQI